MKCRLRTNLSVGLLALALSACAQQGRPKVPVGQQGAPIAWMHSYDQHGRVSVIEDPAGRKTTLGYTFFDGNAQNPVEQISRKTEGGADATYSFDKFGRRVGMKDAIGTTTYSYDGFGRLKRVAREGSEAISYGYDFEGRLTSLGVGEGNEVRYGYDYLGRLSEVASPAGNIAFEYFPAKRQVVRKLPGGVTTTWTFRASGDLESLVHRNAKQIVVAGYVYKYRPDGRLEAVEESGGARPRRVTYEYDIEHRLTRASDTVGQDYRYQYDAVGNRTGVTAQGVAAVVAKHDWAGRIVEYGGKTPIHDAAGNLVEYTGPGGRRVFEHDTQNRLVSATTGGSAVQYEYDGDGKILRRKTGAGTSTFVTDPTSAIWKPLVVRNESGKQTKYVWLGGHVIAEVTDGHAVFNLEDHLGAAKHQIAGASGAVIESQFDPYGNPLQRTSGLGLRVGIGGLFFDDAAGLYLTAARAYAPEVGQFVERDPAVTAGATGGASAYAYCAGDPVNLVDTTGNEPSSPDTAMDYYARKYLENPNWVSGLIYGGAAVLHEMPKTLERSTDFFRDQATKAYSAGHNAHATAWLSAGTVLYTGLKYVTLRLSADSVIEGISAATDPYRTTSERLWGLAYAPSDLLVGDLVKGTAERLHLVTATQPASEAQRLFQAATDAGYGSGFFPFYDGLKVAERARQVYGTLLEHVNMLTGEVVGGWVDRRSGSSPVDTRLHPTLPNANETRVSAGGPCPGGSCGDDGGPGVGGSNRTRTIGGVSLAAAPDALAYLGDIEGVVLDEKNGRIVLISSTKGTVDLPPLQLDDIATIFRAVYSTNSGGPYVSIDPDPTDLKKPRTVRIEPLIQDTHVGWVLFEADRVMKGYAAGKDNVTGNPLKSRVPGYRSVPELVMAGGAVGESRNRYWITPSEIKLEQSTNGGATVVTSPMKVATEKLLTGDGQLTSLKGVTSPHSEAFARWFTDNYSRIEEEYAAVPPSGGHNGVPERVFAQVRRMSAISAVAYSLLAQGKPIPRWVQDWKPAKVPVPRTTPTVQARKERQEAVRGGTRTVGVEYLGGACTLAKSAKDPNCPVPVIVADSPRANALRSAANAALKDPSPFARAEFTTANDGVKHRAVALPGWETKDLGANVLVQTDLAPRSGAGTGLALNRHSNSFSAAGGEMGANWQIDVPVLVAQARAVLGPDKRIRGYCQQKSVAWPLGGKQVGLSPRYELRDTKPPEKDGATASSLAPKGRTESLLPKKLEQEAVVGFFLPAEGDCTTGSVEVVDQGKRVYADDDGRLLALKADERMRLYRWTRSGETRLLARIEEWLGDKVVAKIELAYDGVLVKSAVGCWGGDVEANKCAERRSVSYEYDAGHRLARVSGDGLDVRYAYREGQVARADVGRGVNATSFEYQYDRQGHLVRERLANGTWVKHDVSHGGRGMVAVSRVGSGSGARVASAEYDSELRLSSRNFPDGAKENWEYSTAGTTSVTTLADGRTFKSVWDAKGRLQVVDASSGPAVQLEWGDGSLPSKVVTASNDYVLTPDGSGGLSRFLVAPRGRTNESLEVELGGGARTFHLRLGGEEYRAKDVVSSDGTSRQIEWGDPKANPDTVNVSRHADGKVEAVTSWGDRQTITAQGIVVTRGGKTAQVEFNGNRPVKLVDFDRGETKFEYDGQGALTRMTSPGGVVVQYGHDPKTRTETMTVGGKYALTAKYDTAGRLVSLVQAPAVQ